MDDPREALLEELRSSLDTLITGFESGLAEDALAGLWSACDETFARFRTVHEAHAGEEIPDGIRRKMEGVLRLQAVVSTLAARLRDDLTLEADKLANARARLDSLASKAHVGKSCDLTG